MFIKKIIYSIIVLLIIIIPLRLNIYLINNQAYPQFLELQSVLEDIKDIDEINNFKNKHKLDGSNFSEVIQLFLPYLDKKMKYVLYYAANYCNEDLVKLILDFFLEYKWVELSPLVDSYDGLGRTALHWACEGGYKNIVKLLLEYDIDIDVRDNDGECAFDLTNNIGIRVLLLNHYREKVRGVKTVFVPEEEFDFRVLFERNISEALENGISFYFFLQDLIFDKYYPVDRELTEEDYLNLFFWCSGLEYKYVLELQTQEGLEQFMTYMRRVKNLTKQDYNCIMNLEVFDCLKKQFIEERILRCPKIKYRQKQDLKYKDIEFANGLILSYKYSENNQVIGVQCIREAIIEQDLMSVILNQKLLMQQLDFKYSLFEARYYLKEVMLPVLSGTVDAVRKFKSLRIKHKLDIINTKSQNELIEAA